LDRSAGAGLTIAAGAVAFYFVPKWQMLHYAIAMLTVTVFALGWALLQSALFLKKLEPEEKLEPDASTEDISDERDETGEVGDEDKEPEGAEK
jgi:hypothetical protein